jgi:hypothetical protein
MTEDEDLISYSLYRKEQPLCILAVQLSFPVSLSPFIEQYITLRHGSYIIYPVWRRVRIPPPYSLRVVRGDENGTKSQMRR